ncbi:MAG: glutathione S-transferase [Rhodospirillaceae bacterium]|jgi:glutathione S-transferase|nr:glutathione S-transferase [Rhodospirillaceae bacterium]
MKLVIAKPSPFARKVRVVLREKAIAVDELVDVPWNADTVTPAHNPLGKVPVLLPDDGPPVYDSGVIVEYLETLGEPPRLIPENPKQRFAVRQIEALADGICDAVVLVVLEQSRIDDLQSADWIARQRAKVTRGLAALDHHLGASDWFVGDTMSVADIAAGCALAYLDLRLSDEPWREIFPTLAAFSDTMESRPSFQATRPEVQQIAPVG